MIGAKSGYHHFFFTMNLHIAPRLASFIFSLLLVTIQSASAQDNTVETKPYQRPESSLAIPFGVSASYSFVKVLALEEDEEEKGNLLQVGPIFGVDLSYDTWFAGYHRQIYGDVFRIGNRPAERELFSGLYLEIGALTQKIDHYSNGYYSGELLDSTTDNRIPVIAFGTDFTNGYGNETSTRWRGNYTVGYASGDENNTWFGSASFGVGVRIPFGTHAIDLGGDMFAGVLPFNSRSKHSNSYYNSDEAEAVPTSYVYGAGLTATVTLGFNN